MNSVAESIITWGLVIWNVIQYGSSKSNGNYRYKAMYYSGVNRVPGLLSWRVLCSIEYKNFHESKAHS